MKAGGAQADMATRPVFVSITTQPYVEVIDTEFKYHSGFAVSQAQKSIRSLSESFCTKHPQYIGKILEVSSKAAENLGVRLSAFNLMYTMRNGTKHTVETVFQAGKCFENGMQYIDLLNGSSYDAKKDERLHSSGNVIGFKLEEVTFPAEPITFFYDWLYINALHQNTDLAQQAVKYSAFTDIAFNPAKSLNCQARAAAVYVGLHNSGMLKKALMSPEAFLHTVFGQTTEKTADCPPQQLDIWSMLQE